MGINDYESSQEKNGLSNEKPYDKVIIYYMDGVGKFFNDIAIEFLED